MPIVEELVTILGVDIDPTTMALIHGFKEGMSKIEDVAKKAAIAVGAFAASAIYTLKTIGQNSESLVRLSEQTGVSTDYIQQMNYAVEQLGGDSKSLQADIVGLAKSMTSPIPGQFNETLLMLGIAARTASGQTRNVADVLDDLSARFRSMSSITAMQWGSRLGLSMETIRLLQQGREGIKKLREQLPFVVSREILDAGVKFNQSWKLSWQNIKNISAELVGGFYPAISKALDKFNAWVDESKEWIRLKVKEVVEGISAGFERFWRTLARIVEALKPYWEKLKEILGLTGDLKNKTEKFVNAALFGLTLLLALWAAMSSEILLVVAACSLIGYAIADLINWFSGAKSSIGGFFDEFEKRFPAVYGLLSMLIEIFGTGLVAAIKVAWSAIKMMFSLFIHQANMALKILDKILSKLGFGDKLRIKEANAWYREKAQAGTEGVTSLMDFGTERLWRDMSDKRSYQNRTINNNQKININVNGAGEPNQVGDEIYRRLKGINLHQLNTPGTFAPVAG